MQPGTAADPRVPGGIDPHHHGQPQRPGEERQGFPLSRQLLLASRRGVPA